MSDYVVMPADFDGSQVTLTPPKKSPKNDSINAYVNHKGAPVYPATPALRAPFSASDYKDDGKWGVQLSIEPSTPEDTEGVANWLEQLRAWDRYMLQWGQENWEMLPCFKKKPSPDVAETMYKPLIKDDASGKGYAPTIKIQFKQTKWYENSPVSQENFKPELQFELYDSEDRPIEMTNISQLKELIPGGSRCEVVIRPKFWTMISGYGISLIATVVKVTRRAGFVAPKGNIFASKGSRAASHTADPAYDYPNSTFSAPKATTPAPAPAASTAARADSEEEHEYEEVDEE